MTLFFHKHRLLPVFILLSLLIWINPFAFFYADDWAFVSQYAQDNFFKSIAHGQHVIPFFKLFYYLELILFGKNTILFQAANTVMWGLFVYVFYLILGKIFEPGTKRNYFILILTAVLFIHPNFVDIICWIFQQCVIMHLLFQALAILYFLNYLKTESKNDRNFFFLFLILQNYAFGNGLFFPLLFISFYILEKKKVICEFTVITSILFVGFLITQLLFGEGDKLGVSAIFQNFFKIISAFFYLVSVSVTRLFVIKNFGGHYFNYLFAFAFLIICLFCYKANKKYFLFSILYLFFSAISVSIARSSIADLPDAEVHYYYSILLFPPLILMLFIALSEIVEKHLKIAGTIACFYLFGLFFVGIQSKKIYMYKDFKNKEAISNAVKFSKENYYPFDDSFHSGSRYVYTDNIENPEIQKSLQKSNYFGYDSTIVSYLGGEDRLNAFLRDNKKFLNSYKYLVKHSFFDLDLTYEKKY